MKVASARYPAAELKDLAEIRQFVEEAAIALGGEQDVVSELVLAANEAVANVILHGYKKQPGYIMIDVARVDNDLEIRIRDLAPKFDPTIVPVPDVTLPLSQRPIGGMGVHFMRTFTDELRYNVTADGQNELTLVKHDVV